MAVDSDVGYDGADLTRHQYGISALVSQKSFGRETSGSVNKCWLFSQAQTHPDELGSGCL